MLLALSGLAAAQGRYCIDHDTLQFGNRPVGSSTAATVTVSNCGNDAWTFTDVSVHPATGPGYAVNATCATGSTLGAGASCTLTVTFAPTGAGQQSGAVWLRNTTGTPTQLLTFYGRGTTDSAGASSLGFSPSPLVFVPQPVGTASAAVALALVNQGSVAITPSALVVNGPAAYDFSGTGDCAVGRPIAAGGSCHLALTFTPGDVGARLANLVVDAPELGGLAVLQIAGTGVETTVPPQPLAATVVEFFNAARNGYFLTADAAEAANIDAGGVGPGWTRTGRTFQAWTRDGDAPAQALPVCRFFGTPGLGPDSHFYTADPAECAAVRANRYWQDEGIAFRGLLPAAGTCPTGTDAVLRVYRPSGDATGLRHRYVTQRADADVLVAAGWTYEGPVFCSPR